MNAYTVCVCFFLYKTEKREKKKKKKSNDIGTFERVQYIVKANIHTLYILSSRPTTMLQTMSLSLSLILLLHQLTKFKI